MNETRVLTSLILGVLLLISVSSCYPSTDQIDLNEEFDWIDDAIHSLTIPPDVMNNTALWDDECSSVIVTGTAAKDGRPILMKNRDWPDSRPNRPAFVPATTHTFAFVAIYGSAMGINERGLAVMNTAMPALEPEPGYGNLLLNQRILEGYESVRAVATALNDTGAPIGPVYRSSLGTIATCLGIIDRFGEGAFFEVSNTQAYVQYIVDGYDTRANHPRIYPILASGPSGRDQYLLDTLDSVYAKNGVISCQDVMQKASRYVRDKELGTSSFSIEGEACNENTVSAMVAVSGDSRYDGKLNVMWGAYGYTPLVSVFVPSMAYAGDVPESTSDLWSHTADKLESAQVRSLELDPVRIQEIQQYSFFAEDYTIEAYDNLISDVPTGLSDSDLQLTLSEFISQTDDYAANVFIEESFYIAVPDPVSFPTPVTTTTTYTNTTSAPSTTIITETTTPTTSTNISTTGAFTNSLDRSLILGFSIGGAVSIVAIFVFLRRYKE